MSNGLKTIKFLGIQSMKWQEHASRSKVLNWMDLMKESKELEGVEEKDGVGSWRGKSPGGLDYRLERSAKAKKESVETVIVTLHPAVRGAETFDLYREILSEREDCALLRYNRAGFGQSCRVPNNTWAFDYLEREADQLAEFLKELNVSRRQKVLLFGHCDGATIAMIAAAKFPFLCDAVIAEAPHSATPKAEQDRLVRGFEVFNKMYLGNNESSQMFARVLGREHTVTSPTEVLERWGQVWGNPDFLNQFDISHYLRKVRVPALVLHGAEDPFWSIEHAKQCAELMNAQFVLVENAGHTPHNARPDFCNSYILPFIDRLRSSSLSKL